MDSMPFAAYLIRPSGLQEHELRNKTMDITRKIRIIKSDLKGP
jgi:hypothetical protein